MSNNDFYTVAYKILDYLKYCYEQGKKADANILSEGTFSISHNQFLRTLKMLVDKGYIDGTSVKVTPDGFYILNNIGRAAITMAGLDYLHDNNAMQEAANQYGEVKQWLPAIQ